MAIEDRLAEHKKQILKRWAELIAGTYPAETARFFAREKDRFANPVGYNIQECIQAIFDGLLQHADGDYYAQAVDGLVRVRAIQEFSAGQAVAFVSLLRYAVRDELLKDDSDTDLLREIMDFDLALDQVLLVAFDAYMGCREKILDIKARELRNRHQRILKRYEAMLVKDPALIEPDTDTNN